MGFGQREEAVWFQKGRNDPRPSGDIRQPDQGAPTCENAVERTRFIDRRLGVVDVSLHEPSPIRQAEVGGERSGCCDRRRRKVEAGDRGTLLRERQRIFAKMTLQMQHSQAVYWAEDVGGDRVEVFRAVPERIEVIVQRRGVQMDWNALIPIGEVQSEPVGRDNHHDASTTSPPVAGSAPPSILPSTIRIACTQANV
jgi:hypothetical protein